VFTELSSAAESTTYTLAQSFSIEQIAPDPRPFVLIKGGLPTELSTGPGDNDSSPYVLFPHRYPAGHRAANVDVPGVRENIQ
jgi:hypothetical protein